MARRWPVVLGGTDALGDSGREQVSQEGRANRGIQSRETLLDASNSSVGDIPGLLHVASNLVSCADIATTRAALSLAIYESSNPCKYGYGSKSSRATVSGSSKHAWIQ